MNHPTNDEWMSYLYEEENAGRPTLAAHLETCEVCQEQVARWRKAMGALDHWQISAERSKPHWPSIVSWAAAVAAIFLFGFVLGRSRPAGNVPATTQVVSGPSGEIPQVETDPMKARFQKAEAIARQGELDRAALEYVAAAVKYSDRPESAEAYRRAGDLMLQADDIAGATYAYREFISKCGISPGTPEAGHLVSGGKWLLVALASDPNMKRRTMQ